LTTDEPVVIGTFPWNGWTITSDGVDLTRNRRESTTVMVQAEPQRVAIDLTRTALVVIDMQNEFCTPGGWVHYSGFDLTAARALFAPISTLASVLRRQSVPIIWLNWGNRPDRANVPSGVLHVVNPDGTGFGIGDLLPGMNSRVLERGSWSTAVADELAPEDGDIHVDKYRISGFWDTELDSILRNLDVSTLLFAGVNVDQCVLATLTDAACIGYDCILLADCSATTSPAFCTEATVYNVKRSLGFVLESTSIIDAIAGLAERPVPVDSDR
jgi:nicotinamidase-related amidase